MISKWSEFFFPKHGNATASGIVIAAAVAAVAAAAVVTAIAQYASGCNGTETMKQNIFLQLKPNSPNKHEYLWAPTLTTTLFRCFFFFFDSLLGIFLLFYSDFFCVFVFVLLVSSMNLTYWSSCARINAPTTQLNGIHMGPITNELTPKEFSQIIATIYEWRGIRPARGFERSFIHLSTHPLVQELAEKVVLWRINLKIWFNFWNSNRIFELLMKPDRGIAHFKFFHNFDFVPSKKPLSLNCWPLFAKNDIHHQVWGNRDFYLERIDTKPFHET